MKSEISKPETEQMKIKMIDNNEIFSEIHLESQRVHVIAAFALHLVLQSTQMICGHFSITRSNVTCLLIIIKLWNCMNNDRKHIYRCERNSLDFQSSIDRCAFDGADDAFVDFVVDENNMKTIAAKYHRCLPFLDFSFDYLFPCASKSRLWILQEENIETVWVNEILFARRNFNVFGDGKKCDW